MGDKFYEEVEKKVESLRPYLEEFLDGLNDELQTLIREHMDRVCKYLDECVKEIANEVGVESREEEDFIHDRIADLFHETLDNPFFHTRENDWVQSLQYDLDW